MVSRLQNLYVPLLCLLLLGVFFSPICNATDSNKDTEIVGTSLRFVSYLKDHKFAEADSLMDKSLKDALIKSGIPDMGQFWLTLEGQLGSTDNIETPYVRQKAGNITVTVVPVQFKAGIFDMQISLLPNSLIAGLQVLPHSNPIPESPEYSDVSSFTEREIQLGYPEAPVKGMITIPKNRTNYPAVVLLSGSGPNDMDETLGPNKPLRDIAWGLATKGIAVVRFDKRTRTYGAPKDPNMNMIQYEYIDDALAAINYVSKLPGVSKVFLAGHSLGAQLAPIITALSPEIAGAICIAAPASSLQDLVAYQYQYLSSIGFAQKSDADEVAKAVLQYNNGYLKDTDFIAGIPVGYIKELGALGSPVSAAEKLDRPIFLAFGSRDYQVPVSEYNIWQKELNSKGDGAYTIKLYEGLNHIMMKGDGAPNPNEYMVPGHVSQLLVDDISQWVLTK